MGQIVITLPDDKLTPFIKFIKDFDAELTVLPFADAKNKKNTSSSVEKEIKELFGIWEKSDISLDKIRRKVWPEKAI